MKRFITVRMWEETKDKLEQVRMDKSMKEKKIVKLQLNMVMEIYVILMLPLNIY